MPVPVKCWAPDVEASAQRQLDNLATLPFLHHHVAAMPDVHWGMSATVGSVLAMRGAIVPAAVGVDIGCGVAAVRLSLSAAELPDDLRRVRTQIERDVPVGFEEHSDARLALAPDAAARLQPDLAWLREAHPRLHQRDADKLWRQVGTLGGGNHFIELCLDEEQRVWVMLHSGSRNIGKVIAEYFISRAKASLAASGVKLPDADLAWLEEGSQDFADYVRAVGWAQDYALEPRPPSMLQPANTSRPDDTTTAVPPKALAKAGWPSRPRIVQASTKTSPPATLTPVLVVSKVPGSTVRPRSSTRWFASRSPLGLRTEPPAVPPARGRPDLFSAE